MKSLDKFVDEYVNYRIFGLQIVGVVLHVILIITCYFLSFHFLIRILPISFLVSSAILAIYSAKRSSYWVHSAYIEYESYIEKVKNEMNF